MVRASRSDSCAASRASFSVSRAASSLVILERSSGLTSFGIGVETRTVAGRDFSTGGGPLGAWSGQSLVGGRELGADCRQLLLHLHVSILILDLQHALIHALFHPTPLNVRFLLSEIHRHVMGKHVHRSHRSSVRLVLLHAERATEISHMLHRLVLDFTLRPKRGDLLFVHG